jgi:hypothetical protein
MPKETPMRPAHLLGILLLTLSVLGWPIVSLAQDKTARGTITEIGGDTLTVKVGANEMQFNVDAKTQVVAAGASTKTRKAASAGQPAPMLGDLVTTGQAVRVSFRDTGARLYASRIEVVPSAGAGGGSVTEPKPSAKTERGRLKSVAANAVTLIAADGREITFTVDGSTTVIGQSLGTKSQAAGGKIAITELVREGDQVSVTYHDMGTTPRLTSLRVITPAAK